MIESKQSKRLSKMRKIAWALLCTFSIELAQPTTMWALTSGPSAPEFSSFEPVGTTNLVNPFTGDFTYNVPVVSIPGADGGGYALSLSYHSGVSVEEEASWVGYGWTLNPGAINRSKNGYPDDWNGKEVTQFNKARPNVTAALGGSVSGEILSVDASANASVRFNNYKGFGYTVGVSVSEPNLTCATLGYAISDGEGSFSLTADPWSALSNGIARHKKKNRGTMSKFHEMLRLKKSGDKKAGYSAQSMSTSMSLLGGYGYLDYGTNLSPQPSVARFSGKKFDIGITGSGTFLPFNFTGGVGMTGSFSYQSNTESHPGTVYGHMYSGHAAGDAEGQMDYVSEKSTPFNKRDLFLGIPISQPDYYSVTGEGVSGMFRAYHKKLGMYRPASVVNKTQLVGIGFDTNTGVNNGVGFDVSLGEQVSKSGGDWGDKNPNTPEYAFSSLDDDEDEAVFFRFANDMGGWVNYGDHTETHEWARLAKDGAEDYKTTNLEDYDLKTDHPFNASRQRIGRSSYIGHHTFGELNGGVAEFEAYEKSSSIDNFIGEYTGSSLTAIEDQIREFSIAKPDGARYTYGLPVFAKEEYNLSYGYDGGVPFNNQRVLMTQSEKSNSPTKNGTYSKTPYVSAYLLTSITNDNYIDRTNDGCTSDDFGGYTHFVYKQAHGSLKSKANSGTWYRWRFPYNGMNYAKNAVSNPRDDMASESSGEKEVYYLDKIETKTHVAEFITSNRTDGLSAAANNVAGASNKADGSDKLQKLDEIRLYTRADWVKKEDGQEVKPLQVVHFEYDYSLATGVPNGESGKLTLRRMWIDYGGVFRAKISPYQFDYNYPTSYPTEIEAKYPTILDGYVDTQNDVALLNENPAYAQYLSDAWGNYGAKGAYRHQNMIPWLSYHHDETDFDPAAWNLKQIKLPSGGEIHVQYEQDTYTYVQNQRAHIMAPLDDDPSVTQTKKEFKINLHDLGITQTTDKQDVLRYILKEYRGSQKKKMYYKFLYQLFDSGTAPGINNTNSEYITGYAYVSEAVLDGEHLVITLGNGDDTTIPKKVCKDFIKANRVGLSGGPVALLDDLDSEPSKDWVRQNFSKMRDQVKKIGNTVLNNPFEKCKVLDEARSFLKIPIPLSTEHAKKGGGVRVKRLLTYDPGMETGAARLYGSEYIYEDFAQDKSGKIISSGVATNEPVSMREENVLIGYLPRTKQNGFSKIVSGRDKKISEGYIGESFLPGPSVGYSRVVVQNIHTGASNTGHQIYTYHTAYDAPLSVTPGPIVPKNINYNAPLFVYNKSVNRTWNTQGYKTEIQSKHGSAKAVEAYQGVFGSGGPLVSSTSYEYFGKKDKLPVMYGLNDIVAQPLGQEMDVVQEKRIIDEHYNGGNLEFDPGVGIFGITILPTFSMFGVYTESKQGTRTHVVNKVTRYPVVVRAVENYSNGVTKRTENVAFDPHTGSPIVTRTFDDYHGKTAAAGTHKGTYTNFSVPAYRDYAAFNPKYFNEGFKFSAKLDKVVDGTKVHLAVPEGASPAALCELSVLTEGDLIKVGSNEYYHISKTNGTKIEVIPTYTTSVGSDISNAEIEVIRSGHNNLLAAVSQSFTTYGELDDVSGVCEECLPVATHLDIEDVDPNYAQKQAFAAALTAALDAGQDGSVDIPAGMLKHPVDGSCLEASDLKVNFKRAGDKLLFKLGLFSDELDTKYCGYDDVTWNPVVEDLNGTLERYMLGPLRGWDGDDERETCIKDEDLIPRYPDSRKHAGNYLSSYRNKSCVEEQYFYSHMNNSFNKRIYDCYNLRHDQGPRLVPVGDDPYQLYFLTFRKNKIGKQEILYRLSNMNFKLTDHKYLYIDYGVIRRSFNKAWVTFRVYLTDTENGTQKYFQIGGHSHTARDFVKSLTQTHRDHKYGGCWFTQVDGRLHLRISQQHTYRFGGLKDTETKSQGMTELGHNGVILMDLGINVVAEPISLCDGTFDKVSGAAHQFGRFGVDEKTGSLVYYYGDTDCNPTQLCLEFCESNYPSSSVENVVASTATTFNDTWSYTLNEYGTVPANQNPYAIGSKGQWRPEGSYVYRNDASGIKSKYSPLTSTAYNYEVGTYSYDVFSHIPGSTNDPSKWIKTSTVTKYSPNGVAEEEQDALGIYSAAKFGYDHTVPYLVAGNANKEVVFFEGFESAAFEGGASGDINNTYTDVDAHSGAKALSVQSNKTMYRTPDFAYTDQLSRVGMRAQLWVKGYSSSKDFGLRLYKTQDGSSYSIHDTYAPKILGQVGHWTLVEIQVPASAFDDQFVDYALELRSNALGSGTYLLDDIRIQPTDAQMAAYVYEPGTYRLLAQFDNQHYGLFYQYDQEGKLIRTEIETERGRKMLQETQYNTPKWSTAKKVFGN